MRILSFALIVVVLVTAGAPGVAAHHSFAPFNMHRVAHPGGPRKLDEPLEELVVNALLHQQPGPGNARLASRCKDARNGPFYRIVDLRIVEHDVRRLAAELHAQPT